VNLRGVEEEEEEEEEGRKRRTRTRTRKERKRRGEATRSMRKNSLGRQFSYLSKQNDANNDSSKSRANERAPKTG
jgi:hypothetical protein